MAKTTNQLVEQIHQIHQLLHQAEELKKLLRHAWLSNNRQESVAEHTWRMALMAILISPHLKQKVDLGKTLQMVLIHDFGEILAGDFHAFKKVPQDKHQLELKSLKKLLKKIDKKTSDKIINLWLEFEDCQTPEAKFAQALDKIEVLIQHNEADTQTWVEKEFEFNYYYGYDKVTHEKALHILRDLVLEETIHKINLEPIVSSSISKSSSSKPSQS